MATPVVVSRIQNRRGTQAQFDALYPPLYNGIGGVDINVWPNILLPGEIALLTDTRRIYIGNINGEYTELASSGGDGFEMQPSTWVLPPSPTFTVVTKTLPPPAGVVNLEYTPTPFFSLFYDVTDSTSPDWDVIGTDFAANGVLKISAINPATVAPAHTSMIDDRSEVNNTSFNISFKAEYNGPLTDIVISYMHDFPGSLTFATSTIRWVPF